MDGPTPSILITSRKFLAQDISVQRHDHICTGMGMGMHLYKSLKTPRKFPNEANKNKDKEISLHNHTAGLLQLAHDLGQHRIDNLFDLVLLLRMLLLVMSLLLARVPAMRALVRCLVRRVGGHDSLTTGEIDVNPTSVILGGIFQAEFAANLLDARLDLLDVAGGVVALADDAGDRSAGQHHCILHCHGVA